MIFMDSDILGILLALFTFVVPVISSVLEKKRKKAKGEPDEEPAAEQDEVGEFHEDVEDLFNELLGLKKQETDSRDLDLGEDLEPGPDYKMSPEPLAVEIQPMAEDVVKPGITENVVSAIQNSETVQRTVLQEEENASEEVGTSLKERFRSNPKDAVIFAEILNPKFKEN